MYKKTKEISGVSGIKLFKKDLYYTMENELKMNHNLIIQGVEGYSFWFIDGGIYFFNEDGERKFRKGGVDHLIKFPLFVGTEFESNILCRSNFRRENRKWCWELGVYDLQSFSVMKELPFENYSIELVVANVGIGYFEKNKISALDINKGQIKWELELEQFGEVELKEFLGVYKTQLLVACNDHLLLSIDVNTGERLRTWREVPGFEAGQFYKDVLPKPRNFVLDKTEAKLIGAFDTYYFEIDIVSGEISYFQLKDELSKYGISDFRPFNNNSFNADHLFLTAHTYLDKLPDVDLSSVLALNRQTKKVDWIHIFETGLGTNVPQITSTHLYQLDTEKNLHVFERTV